MVQPETRKAWRDLATQQWLRRVEVMFRLYYECGIDAKYVTPKHQKKKVEREE